MSIEKRRYIRFSLDIPAIRFNKYGESVETVLHQISIGGCLAEWDESVLVGEEFRLLVQLPNLNWLPLTCKTVYRVPEGGIGATFLSITPFEQQLISRIIANNLQAQGLPVQVDPFGSPNLFEPPPAPRPRLTDPRVEADEMLEDILSLEN